MKELTDVFSGIDIRVILAIISVMLIFSYFANEYRVARKEKFK